MVDDEQFSTLGDLGAVDTQRNPKQDCSGLLADVISVANVQLIATVSIRCREENTLTASIRRIIRCLDGHGKKPAVFFFNRGY